MAQNKNVWQDLGQRDMTLLYNLRFWSLTLLRLFLGFTFAYHGFLRLFIQENINGAFIYFTQIGMPYPIVSIYIVGIAELVGGLLLLLGLFTRWSSTILAVLVAYLLLKVHLKFGFLVSNNGYEFALLLVAALVVVLVNGSGHLSLGRSLNKNWQ